MISAASADGCRRADKMSDDYHCESMLNGAPVQVVAETDNVLAFQHVQTWETHIVVMPLVVLGIPSRPSDYGFSRGPRRRRAPQKARTMTVCSSNV